MTPERRRAPRDYTTVQSGHYQIHHLCNRPAEAGWEAM